MNKKILDLPKQIHPLRPKVFLDSHVKCQKNLTSLALLKPMAKISLSLLDLGFPPGNLFFCSPIYNTSEFLYWYKWEYSWKDALLSRFFWNARQCMVKIIILLPSFYFSSPFCGGNTFSSYVWSRGVHYRQICLRLWARADETSRRYRNRHMDREKKACEKLKWQAWLVSRDNWWCSKINYSLGWRNCVPKTKLKKKKKKEKPNNSNEIINLLIISIGYNFQSLFIMVYIMAFISIAWEE